MKHAVSRIWTVPVLVALCLGGCTTAQPSLPDASQTAEAIASALVAGDISGLPFAGVAADAVKEYAIVTAKLNGVRPQTVEVGEIAYQPDAKTASVRLTQTYDLGDQWQFPSVATLTYSDSDGWQVSWAPTIVQPALDGTTRLTLTTTTPQRGEILGAGGIPIVMDRPVYKVGIDKSQVSAAQAVTSAKALAKLVGVDGAAYAKQVAAGGPRQFVVAITLRDGQVPDISGIPGSLAQAASLPLAPTKTFAAGLLGVVGDATAEDIAKSPGTVRAGDVVGKTGLQAAQDGLLRGNRGYTVYLARRADADIAPEASPLPSPSAAVTEPQVLFQSAAVPGTDLQTTLDIATQTKAEKVLSKQSGVAAMVVLDVKTGAILAAANSPAAGANPYATTGRYAPGSTFKVSTALALLRDGFTEDSKIDCPVNVTVGGMTFKNVTGYAKSHNGSITLRQAVAWSCNTAMVNGSKKLAAGDLSTAAASLGIGSGDDLGFPAFLGSVPSQDSDVAKAAASFGQSNITASPLAMAAEAASVGAGHTVIPYLLVDDKGQPIRQASGESAQPLTPAEAAALRDMMSAVVTIGSGSLLKGQALGAKTGTAEFTQDGKTLTHAWMIAYTSKYAVAAFVNTGVTGATSAGPLIKAFIS